MKEKLDPLTLILLALGAGLVGGMHSTAGKAVEDAYEGLKTLIKRRLVAMNQKPDSLFQMYERNSKTGKQALKNALVKAAVAQDIEVLRAAQQLLPLMKTDSTMKSKYQIEIAGNSHSIIAGDNNHIEVH